jgi:hypothetical protein
MEAQARRVLQEQRPDLNFDNLISQGYKPDEIFEAFRPGPTVASSKIIEDEARLVEDFNALRRTGANARQIAQYAAERTRAATGLGYEDLINRGMSNDDIIATLFSQESVVERQNPFLFKAARGVTRSAPGFAGAVAGGLTGAAVGGPFAPITSLLGTLIGGVGGSPAGEYLANLIYGPDTPVVPGQEFMARTGTFVGETIPFMFAPHVLAARMPSAQLSLLQHRVQQGERITPFDSLRLSAATRPKATLSAEGTSTLAGSVFAAAAQQTYFPGQPESIVPDLVGAGVGALTPARALNNAVTSLADNAVKAITNLGSKAETRSANMLADVVMRMYDEAGRDPQITIDRLKTTPLADLAERYGVDVGEIGTLVRAGDDPVLRDLFASIQNVSSTMGPTKARARQADMLMNLEGIGQIARIMSATGDPTLVQTAAQIEREVFTAGLQMNFDAHLARASETAKKLLIQNPLAQQEASEIINKALDDALSAANRQREKLYDAVDNSMPSPNGFTNFAARVAELDEDLKLVRNIDPFAKNAEDLKAQVAVLEEAQRSGADITVGDMRKLRKTMLANMRRAGAGPVPDKEAQRIWGELAESVMDDLMLRPEKTFAGTDPVILRMLSANDRALMEANAFNVAFYDVFGRAFPGQIIQKAASGGRRVPVELIAESFKRGSGDATDIRYRDVDDAVNLVVSRYPSPEAQEAADQTMMTLRSAQDTILRSIASRVVDRTDPDNPRIDLERLSSLMRADNPNGFGPALSRLTDLQNDLLNATTAEKLLQDVISGNAAAEEALQSQKFLTTLLKVDAGQAIGEAIGSPGSRPYNVDRGGFTGEADLGYLVNLAKRSSDPNLAVKGVVDTVLDRGIVYATNEDGSLSFREFRKFLTGPLGEKKGSVIDVLRREGAITAEQDINIRTMLREGEIIETALRGGKSDADASALLKDVSPINLVLIGRFLGAREGARLQNLAGMNTIQIPGYFAQLGGRIASRIPAAQKLDVFSRFMDDPEFARVVLERGVERQAAAASYSEMKALERTLNGFQNYLIKAGLITSTPAMLDVVGEFQGLIAPTELPGAAEAATLDQFVPETGLQIVSPAEMIARMPPSVPPRPAAGPAVAPSAPAPRAAPVGPPPPVTTPPAGRAAAPTGQSRAAYSAMFPSDIVSPLIQSQGIAGLMGPQ